MTDKKSTGDLPAQRESHPNYETFIRALMRGPEIMAGTTEQGAAFILAALRGFGMRHHFDGHHPDRVEEGLSVAPAEGPDRQAWLYGYRFVERKEPSDG